MVYCFDESHFFSCNDSQSLGHQIYISGKRIKSVPVEIFFGTGIG